MFQLDLRGFGIAVVAVACAAWLASQYNQRAELEPALGATSTRLTGSLDDDGVTYATVDVVRPAPPLSFESAPLPNTSRDLYADSQNARWVRSQLCAASPGYLKRVHEQFSVRVDTAEAMFGGSLDACGGRALCAEAQGWVDAGTVLDPFMVRFYSRTLSACDLESTAGLLERPGASPIAMARWSASHPGADFSAQMIAALRQEVRDGGFIGDTWELSHALRAKPLPPAIRGELEIARDAGSRVATLVLASFEPRPVVTRPPDLAAALSNKKIYSWSLLLDDGGMSATERDAVVQCARTDGPAAKFCLQTLAALDWSMAHDVAMTLPTTRTEAIALELRRFARHSDLSEVLSSAGFDAGEYRGDLSQLAWASGIGHRAFSLDDPETNAELGEPELFDVIFIHQKAKTAGDGNRIFAFANGARYELTLPSGCNVKDPTAALGLLNVLMRELGSPRRYFTFSILGSRAGMVGAMRPAQFQALVRAGLVTALPPGVAANAEDELDAEAGPDAEPD